MDGERRAYLGRLLRRTHGEAAGIQPGSYCGLSNGRIAEIMTFDARLFPAFGMPATL